MGENLLRLTRGAGPARGIGQEFKIRTKFKKKKNNLKMAGPGRIEDAVGELVREQGVDIGSFVEPSGEPDRSAIVALAVR